jgi:hypothetical protein
VRGLSRWASIIGSFPRTASPIIGTCALELDEPWVNGGVLGGYQCSIENYFTPKIRRKSRLSSIAESVRACRPPHNAVGGIQSYNWIRC